MGTPYWRRIVKMLNPLQFPPQILLIGTLLLWSPWHREGMYLVTLACLLFFILRLPSWARILLVPLENRYSRPDPLPEKIDGIIVLGGAVNPGMTAARNTVSLSENCERLVHFVDLARRFPDARKFHLGGASSVKKAPKSESEVSAEALAMMGLPSDDVIFDTASGNTHENAVAFRQLVGERDDATWLLVTSARHMPRAVGCFRACGIPVVPYPIDYLTYGRQKFDFNPFPKIMNSALEAVIYEWIALLVYRAKNWTPEILPKAISEHRSATD